MVYSNTAVDGGGGGDEHGQSGHTPIFTLLNHLYYA